MARMGRTFWLCAGLVAGALLMFGVQSALRKPADAARGATSQESVELALLRAENEQLRETSAAEKARNEQLLQQNEELVRKAQAVIDDIERIRTADKPVAPEAPPDSPPDDDEIMKAVGEFGSALGSIIQGGGEEAKAKIRALFARAGPRAVELLVGRFEDDATDIGLRVAIAHALAQSGNEDAVAALKGVLADPQADMLALRLASHGLAFTDAPGIDDSLLAVAHKTADTGARANAAFGLARRKHPEGVGLYLKATDEAFANRDPAALQYLGGFALLGDDALPPLRERLLTYTEPQAAIMLIEILKGKGDKGALDNLRKLAADEGRPAAVRRSAEGAIKVLESPK
jgi:hypothetical protein